MWFCSPALIRAVEGNGVLMDYFPDAEHWALCGHKFCICNCLLLSSWVKNIVSVNGFIRGISCQVLEDRWQKEIQNLEDECERGLSWEKVLEQKFEHLLGGSPLLTLYNKSFSEGFRNK